MSIRIRGLDDGDREWLRARLAVAWGGSLQAYGGELVDASLGAGLVAIDDAGVPLGVLVHRRRGRGWEIVLVEAFAPGGGVGTALIEACAATARAAGAVGLDLVTTNDNLHALRFYQRRGFRLVGLRSGAVDEARRTLKPTIPVIGEDGIPIRDELFLRRDL